MKWSLPAFAINRPITLIMLIITLLCLGGVSWWFTPIEFLPRVDVPILTCYIPYPNSSPRQVENEVAIPAEGEFMTLSGLERITTYSDSGGCNILMRFGWETDMSLATAELRDRIERLKLKIPPDIERVFIRRYYSDQEPVLRFALFRDEHQDELVHSVRTLLKNRLMRVPGVAEVTVSGRANEEVFVEFDQNALLSLNLGIYQVVSVLQSRNINLSVGQMVDGATRYYIRTVNEYNTPAELREQLLTPTGIRLKDVAQVTVREPAGVESFAIDGKRGVFISVQRESEANTAAVCTAVREELERIRQEPAFRGAEVFIFDDQGEVVRFALSQLFTAGKYGGFLAFCVLFMALHRLKPTLAVSLTTPASLVAALVYLYFTGYSLNLVTMAAMLVALGMLVDNAIVVVENIQRRHQLGGTARENAEKGASEVGLAITASTLTTIVVFIPVMYMESGELSMFMKEFAGPVTVALLTSLFLAMTFLPLAESRMLEHEREGWISRSLRLIEQRFPRLSSCLRGITPIEWIKALYVRGLRRVVVRRPVSLGAIAVLLLVTFFVPFQRVGMRMMPSMDMRQVRVNFRTDPNYGYDNLTRDIQQIESIIDGMREELGIQNLYVDRWGSGAYIRAYLVKEEDLEPGETIPYSTDEVRQILSEVLPATVPGGRIDTGVTRASPQEAARISVRLRGDDTVHLEELTEEFRRRMATRPELSEVEISRDTSREELQIHIDETKAASAGTSPNVIAQTVSFALRGSRLPYMKRQGREVPVWAQLQGQDRRTKGSLETITIQGQSGDLHPLNQLVTFERAPTMQGIYRENGKTVTTITARTIQQDLTQVRTVLEELARGFDLPRGYSLIMGDEFEGLQENLSNFRGALIMSVILIYLVMAALFESALLPLSILTSVLLAFVGVYWSLYLSDTSMDTVALVGSILMCGVIVNNGIVIVDHINQLRREGLERLPAILQAGHNRFRPVMMTSLTTILGVMPLAIGASETAGALTSLGRSFVGGLTAGTLLTLCIVPLVYTIVDDIQQWCLRFMGGLAHLRPQPKSSVERT